MRGIIVRVGGDEGGVLRTGPVQGDGGVPEQGDGVRRGGGGAARVVGSLQPHRGRGRSRRQLVVGAVAGGFGLRLRCDDEQHLQPHVSAAAGCGRVKLVPC